MVADAAVVKLHRLPAKRYPGTRTNASPAAAKLHPVMSVTGRGVERVKLTGERDNGHRTLPKGPWVRNRMVVFDLGFFFFQLFDCIDRNGGCFLSRLPAGANPCIVASVDAPSYPDAAQVCPSRRRSSSLMPRTVT